jgi:hypothetical protein
MAFFFVCSGSVGGEKVGRVTLEHGEIAAQTDAAQTERVNRSMACLPIGMQSSNCLHVYYSLHTGLMDNYAF